MISYRKQLLFLIVMAAACAIALFNIYREIKSEDIAELNYRQTVYARQAAKGIETFFDDTHKIMRYLARDRRIIHMDDLGKERMRLLHDIYGDIVIAVTRVDARKRIAYSYPGGERVIGIDVSRQAHIREIFKTHKPVISDVFTSAQGMKAIAFHVPVFRGQTFDGTVALLLSFDRLAKKYLEEIRIGEEGYAWVINASGTEIYCPVPGHTGNSVYENCRDFPDILAMAKEMMKGKEGTATYQFNHIRGGIVENLKKHAVMSPFKSGIPSGPSLWHRRSGMLSICREVHASGWPLSWLSSSS